MSLLSTLSFYLLSLNGFFVLCIEAESFRGVVVDDFPIEKCLLSCLILA